MTTANRFITSTLDADGMLTVQLETEDLPAPSSLEVLVKMEAAPINPSDLNLMFGAVKLDKGTFTPGKIVAPMAQEALHGLRGRIGHPQRPGGEGAGTVIAAGEAPEAQALIGKRVSGVPGGAFSEYRMANAKAVLPLPDDLPIELGAASFVNPMTAIGFVETVKQAGRNSFIHTAASSNLGQMLVKLCAEEGITLINVVRKPEQVELLKGLGEKYVLNSTDADFETQLIDAIDATGARIAFDAIGGGRMAGFLLESMEAAAVKGKPYNRYGSGEFLTVYIYGTLDFGPTVFDRSIGYNWNISGWLMSRLLSSLDAEGMKRTRQRVVDGLTTTFASKFSHSITLDQLFERETVLACNAKTTGEKYLLTPTG